MVYSITNKLFSSLRVSTKFPVGGSVNNYNYINMGNLSLSVNGGNKPGKFTIILNPSSITSASFSAVSANTSMVELDTAGTAVSGGFTWTVITLNPGQSTIVPIDELLFRGQTISVRFKTTGTTSDAEAALNFRELF